MLLPCISKPHQRVLLVCRPGALPQGGSEAHIGARRSAFGSEYLRSPSPWDRLFAEKPAPAACWLAKEKGKHWILVPFTG